MKKYILIVAAFFTAGISGCKKDYLSLEVNPNAPSVTTPQLTLAAALNGSAAVIVNDYTGLAVWGGYWTPSGNFVPNPTLNQFQITSTSLNASWADWYANLSNYNTLQTLASKDPSMANFQAIAMIMKAYGFQHLVDMFNDVPYSQAFQPSTILFPAYDKGSDIYHDLGKQLDAAIALIAKSGSAALPGQSDIVFGKSTTEMANWAKFANSLKLRLAMRVSTSTPGDPLVTDLSSTAGTGYLDGTTEARANPGYGNLSGKQNPFWANYGLDANGNPTGGNVVWRANAFEVSMLSNFNDPRATRLFSLVLPPGSPAGTPPSVVRGNIFGDVTSTNLTNTFTSGQGPGLLQSPAQDAILFSGAESLFLQAEALNDGFSIGGAATTPATAQAAYEAGITASFVDLGAFSYDNSVSPAVALSPTASAAVYYAQAKANVGWAASPDKESAIITQKWISLTGYFNFEGWNEYRRTGIPDLPTSADPAKINPTLPLRVLYPLSELNTNPTNLGKEGTISPFTSKIFWAK